MSHEDSHNHDHHEEQPEGFLNTVFDDTVGGFGILWAILALVAIFLLVAFG